MDMNPYALECMVAQQLAERRAEAARQLLAASLRRRRPSLRAGIALSLIRAGRRLAGRRLPSPQAA